jgi:hypothetical protein
LPNFWNYGIVSSHVRHESEEVVAMQLGNPWIEELTPP